MKGEGTPEKEMLEINWVFVVVTMTWLRAEILKRL
jgi:hypothetical protein